MHQINITKILAVSVSLCFSSSSSHSKDTRGGDTFDMSYHVYDSVSKLPINHAVIDVDGPGSSDDGELWCPFRPEGVCCGYFSSSDPFGDGDYDEGTEYTVTVSATGYVSHIRTVDGMTGNHQDDIYLTRQSGTEQLFRIKNSSNQTIMLVGADGDIAIAGVAVEEASAGNLNATADQEFIVQDATGDEVLRLNDDGDLHVAGTIEAWFSTVAPSGSDSEMVFTDAADSPGALINAIGDIECQCFESSRGLGNLD